MNAIIEHNFKYHPPSPGNAAAHEEIREKAKAFANAINNLLPDTAARERATSITNVESAMMWACAGICRHPIKPSAPAPAKPHRPGHD